MYYICCRALYSLSFIYFKVKPIRMKLPCLFSFAQKIYN